MDDVRLVETALDHHHVIAPVQGFMFLVIVFLIVFLCLGSFVISEITLTGKEFLSNRRNLNNNIVTV